jgi:uncharacterized protein
MSLLVFLSLLSVFLLICAFSQGFFFLPVAPKYEKFPLLFFFGAFALYYGLMVILGVLFALLFSALPFPYGFPKLLLINEVFVLSGGLFLVVYLLALPRASSHILWRNGEKSFKRLNKSLQSGVFATMIAFPLVALFGQIIHSLKNAYGIQEHEIQVAVDLMQKAKAFPLLFWFSLFMIVFLVPFVEELLFRGFLHSWLRSYFSRSFSIVITATLFSFAHFSFTQGISNIEIVGGLWIFSLFLDFLYEKERTLWAPYFAHACFNGISGALLLLKN